MIVVLSERGAATARAASLGIRMACVDREEGLVMCCDAPVRGRSNSSRLAARGFKQAFIIAAPGVRDDERSR